MDIPLALLLSLIPPFGAGCSTSQYRTLLCQPTLEEGNYVYRAFHVTQCSFYQSCQPVSGLLCADGSPCLTYQSDPYLGRVDLAAGTYMDVYADGNCASALTSFHADGVDAYGLYDFWDNYRPGSIWLHQYDTQLTTCDETGGHAGIYFTCASYACPSGYTQKANPSTLYAVEDVPSTSLCCDAPPATTTSATSTSSSASRSSTTTQTTSVTSMTTSSTSISSTSSSSASTTSTSATSSSSTTTSASTSSTSTSSSSSSSTTTTSTSTSSSSSTTTSTSTSSTSTSSSSSSSTTTTSTSTSSSSSTTTSTSTSSTSTSSSSSSSTTTTSTSTSSSSSTTSSTSSSSSSSSSTTTTPTSTSSSSSTSTSSTTTSTSTSSTSTSSSSSTSTSSTTTSTSTTSTSTSSSSSTVTSSTTTSTSKSSTSTSSSSSSSTTATSTSTSSSSSTDTSSTTTSTSMSSTSTSSSSSSSTSTTSTSTSSSSSTSTSTSTSTTSSATLTSTTITFTGGDEERLMQQRQQEASAAVRLVEEGSEAAVREILKTWTQLNALNLSDSNASNESGLLAEFSLSTEVGTVKVVALSPTMAADSVAISAADENSSASVEVPADLLAEISDGSPVLLSITLATEDVAAKFSNLPGPGDAEGADAPIKLASKPLIFSLRGVDGKALQIGRKLQTPLVLRLEATDAAAVGAYWDEEAARWSTAGVRNLVAPERRLRETVDTILAFETDQLAPMFAGILQALSCSTFAQIATETGVRRMARTEWLTRAATIVVFCFVGLSLLALCTAHRQDWKAQQAIAKEDRNALHFNTQESLKDVGAWCPSGGWLLSQCRLLAGTLLRVGSLGAFVGKTLVNHCIEAIHSHRSRVEKQSLRALLRHGSGKLRRSQTRDAMEILGRPGTASHNLDIHGTGFSSVEEFVQGPWHVRVRLLLPAKHPWLAPLRYCAFVRASVRTALLILKLAGAGTVAALFFSADAQLDDNDSRCSVADDLISKLMRKFWISVVSLFVGDAVILFLFLVQWRRTVRKESWTDRKMARQRCVWRLRSLCFWVLSLAYAGCCLFYCLLFLANVTPQDGLDWLEAMAYALVQDLVLVPLSVAVLLGLAATVALTCSRRVREGAENRWIEDNTFFSSCPADKFNGRGERGENANQDEALGDINVMDLVEDASSIDDDLLENLASLVQLSLDDASTNSEQALGVDSGDPEGSLEELGMENHADFLRI